jgi:hypothetical protein
MSNATNTMSSVGEASYITITVQMVAGSPLSDATVAEVAALEGIVSVQRSDEEEPGALVISMSEDVSAAKRMSGVLARMFPGQPVRWGSKNANAK